MEGLVTRRFSPVADVELTYATAAGAGPLPVLLLHGLSQQRHFWGPVIRRLRTRPVAALDQRGHGDSDTAIDVDYSIGACAADAVAVLDDLGWPRAVVVGHSWGASVALAAAAREPERVAGVALIDGGLWSPSSFGPRDEARRRLTPPALGIPEADLWTAVRGGDLGPTWREEVQEALAHTFTADAEGNLRTRLGMDRHMRVLDGLLDHDSGDSLERVIAAGVPVWAAIAERPGSASAGLATDDVLVHRWAGAVHDVPLQWPALVAGFVDALVESEEGGTG